MADQNGDLLLVEEERDSDVKLGRITDTTYQKIEDSKGTQQSPQKKISSYQTVFSVWNTMIGSSILSIPYNVYCAGIIPTIIIGLLYGFICFLTCSVVVKLGGKEKDFSIIVYNYFYYGFGPKSAKVGKTIQIIFNLLMNTGATFIYFLIINQNLFPCICFFLELFDVDIDASDLTPHFDKFSLFYCALIVCVIVFPLTILKEMQCITKFNSCGIYFVSALLIFVIYQGIATLATDSFHFEYKENVEGSKDRNLYLFGENVGLLVGTLSIGLFSHSVILPIMKNNRHQENNQRDLFVGYILVTLTYIIIGIMGYIGFSGSDFSTTFEKNWFRFFKHDNIFILILRILNVVQLISIFPLLFFTVRDQLFSTFFKSYSTKKLPIIIFSIILLSLCVLILYLFYDLLAELISYIGAGAALILVYTISPLTNMIDYYIRHQPKKEIEKLKANKNEFLIPINFEELKVLNPCKAFIFYMCMILIISLGIITLLLQIMPVNFFNIKIEKNQ